MNLFRKAYVVSAIIYIALTLLLLVNAAVSLQAHLIYEAQQFELSAHQVLTDDTVSQTSAVSWLQHHSQASHLHIRYGRERATLVETAEHGPISQLLKTEQWLMPKVSRTIFVGEYIIDYTPEIESQLVHSLTNTAIAIAALFLILMLCFILIRKKIRQQLTKNIAQLNRLLETMLSSPTSVTLPCPLAPEFNRLQTTLISLQHNVVEELEAMRAEQPLLKQDAYHDWLTDLPNKRIFIKSLQQRLGGNSQVANGIVTLIKASTLNHINKTQGYQAGDDYIKRLGEIVKHTAHSYPQAEAFRLSGSDFALIIDRVSEQSASGIAENLCAQFTSFMRETSLESIAHIGMVPFKVGDEVSSLLAYCDNAQSIAQTKGVNAWYLERPADTNQPMHKQNWQELLELTLQGNQLVLYGQYIKPIRGELKSYIELQSRFKNQEGDFVPTHSLISQAEVLDYSLDIDKMVVNAAINIAKSRDGFKETYGVNLSNRSALDAQFVIWLERLLLKEQSVARRLVFEISEHGLHADINACRRFSDAIHRAGARYTIEHFGSSMLSFKYFREMSPDYVKLDGAHTREIETDTKLQYFIRLLVDVTHRMGVKVIAEAVETQQQKQILEMLNIDGIQGYLVDHPTPIRN